MQTLELENAPITQESQQLIIPTKRSKLRLLERITGNRYDLVLAGQPDAKDNYPFYDEVVNLVEVQKNLRIYSPHTDIKRDCKIKEAIEFTVTEAIPRTRAVLMHLTTVTPEIQKMFDATYLNNRAFILFYSAHTVPFNNATGTQIRNHNSYFGEIRYLTESDALEFLDPQIDKILRSK